MRRASSTARAVLWVVVSLVPLGCGPESPRAQVLRSLESLETRALRGRLCCGLSHRPEASSGEEESAVPPEVLARLFGDVSSLHRRQSGPETHAALGVLELLRRRPREAVGRLEESVRLAPERADLHSDLAVARLALAREEGRPIELLEALRSSLAATRLDPALPEAWFNRAVALEELALRGQAGEAWSEVLSLETDAGWRQEAEGHRARVLDESHLRSLEGRLRPIEAGGPVPDDELTSLVEGQPHLLREAAEERLLGLWGRAVEEGRPGDAERYLDLAERIGARLADRWQDAMLSDAVAHLRNLEEPKRRRAAGAAYRAYSEGMRAYYGQLFGDARGVLQRAERELAAVGSPMALSAALYRAICLYYEDADRSREELAEVASRVDADRYGSLGGRVAWMRGVIEMVQGRFEPSLALFEETRHHLARSSGPERAAMADLLLAESYDSRGEVEKGWRYRLAAAREIAPRGDRRKRHALLQDTAQALVRRQQGELALVFLEEEVANARAWGEEAAVAEALAERSRVHSQLADVDAAVSDAERAIEVAATIEDEGARRRVLASARLSLGIALADIDPEGSLEELEAAEVEHEQIGWEFERFALLEAGARAYTNLGRMEEARKLLLSSVRYFEETRSETIDVRSRIVMFQHARRAFDRLIEMQLAQGEMGVRPGFELAERSRARYLLDRLRSNGVAHPEPESLLGALPTNVSLVHYAVLPSRVVAWIVQGGSIRLAELSIGPGDLDQLTTDFREALEREDGGLVAGLSPVLYDRLVRPLGLDLATASRLVVVPDEGIARIPFAALLDRETGRYLVEQVPLTFAPSATLYAGATARSASREGGPLKALVVGQPDLADTEWRDLPPLHLAVQEAESVADLYEESTVLLFDEATAEAVLRELDSHDVFHFSGHAVTRSDEIDEAWLLLSPGGDGSSGTVAVSRLWELDLERTQLVVLSACHGMAGFEQGREGVVSLATSFFAAGVPTVVAALWEVDDQSSYRLMTRFHQLVSTGREPASALRDVMLEEIASNDPSRSTPARWGVFAVLGV